MKNKIENEKQRAAYEAIRYVKDHMILGVGSGSTIKYFIKYLKDEVEDGLKIVVVPTSVDTKNLCLAYGIPVYEGDSVPAVIDLCVDGADEFDDNLNLIKGGGGALLWEKIVASAAKSVIIITDSSKHVKALGQSFLLPVEVIPYAVDSVKYKLEKMGISAKVRHKDDSVYRTDEGNDILDCETGPIEDAYTLAARISAIPGVVEHGIFLDMCDMVLQGTGDEVLLFKK